LTFGALLLGSRQSPRRGQTGQRWVSLPPWTDPLVGGFYSARPKASLSPSAYREVMGEGWRALHCGQCHAEFAPRSGAARFSADPPDLWQKVRQHPVCPSSPRPIPFSAGGFVVSGARYTREREPNSSSRTMFFCHYGTSGFFLFSTARAVASTSAQPIRRLHGLW